MKYRIQIQQVFGGNWANFEEACQKAEWLEKDSIKPRSKAAALEALETQMDLYKNGAPHRVVAYCPDGTFEVLYTLSRGTPWFVSGEEPKQAHASAAKVEEEPLYECEIPGAPGRVTYGKDVQVVGRATRELPPGYFEGRLVSLEIDGRVVSGMDPAHMGSDLSRIFVSGEAFDRITQVIERKEPNAALAALMARPSRFTGRTTGWKVKPLLRGHRVRRYNTINLGIEKHKVMLAERVNSIDMAYGFDRQDARVCAIEQELVRYDGKRRTAHRDRKVARLRKILRTLKRGIYE